MRLIDADALLKASRTGKVMYFDDTTTDGYTAVLLAVEVERAPTINAEPVRYGEWITNGYDTICSACREVAICERNAWGDIERYIKTPYCPNCSAKMDGGNA